MPEYSVICSVFWVPSKDQEIKGVALARFEDGTEKVMPRITSFRMKESGRNVTKVIVKTIIMRKTKKGARQL